MVVNVYVEGGVINGNVDATTINNSEALREELNRFMQRALNRDDISIVVKKCSGYKEAAKQFINAADNEENYLYTIARNLCNDELRKLQREREIIVGQDETAEQECVSIENMVVNQVYVQEILSGLTENDMEILLLKYINNESINDISRIMGISRFALYRRIRRIEKQLKMSIGRIEDE